MSPYAGRQTRGKWQIDPCCPYISPLLQTPEFCHPAWVCFSWSRIVRSWSSYSTDPAHNRRNPPFWNPAAIIARDPVACRESRSSEILPSSCCPLACLWGGDLQQCFLWSFPLSTETLKADIGRYRLRLFFLVEHSRRRSDDTPNLFPPKIFALCRFSGGWRGFRPPCAKEISTDIYPKT